MQPYGDVDRNSDGGARASAAGPRAIWAREATAIGGWLALGSSFAAELLAAERLDYVVIDCQHGLVGYERMTEILGVLGRMDPATFVRVPALEGGWAGRALDAGAEGIIVPLVNSRAEAERAAAACRFPPDGVRSYGPIRASGNLGSAPADVNAAVMCFAMIETVAGLEAASEICSTPGIDGVYIGPADLAIGLGVRPSVRDPAPVVTEALVTIRDECLRHGIIPAIHAINGRQAADYSELGFRMITAVSDAGALCAGAAREVKTARAGQGAVTQLGVVAE